MKPHDLLAPQMGVWERQCLIEAWPYTPAYYHGLFIGVAWTWLGGRYLVVGMN